MSKVDIRNIAKTFDAIRADYDATRQSRFVRRRTGVAPLGGGEDWNFREETRYYQLIEQARDMDRNDGLVGTLADRRVDNVVQQGFTLDTKTGDKKLDQDLWQRWQAFANDPEMCDIAGEMTFHEMERFVCRAESIDGDIIGVGTEDGPLQLHEAHAVQTSTKIDNTFLGVTRDQFGKRTQYHVRYDLNQFAQKSESIPIDVRNEEGVRQLFHVYNPKRISATRGVTQLAPVFSLSGMLEDINFAKLVQQQIVSCFAILRQKSAGSNGNLPSVDAVSRYGEPSSEQTGSGSRQLEGISPGMEIEGAEGETLSGFSPNVPNSEYFQQVKLILQIVGVNFGLPLCLVLMDGSETNFSGWRGAVDEARKGFVADQLNLVRRWHSPVYRWWLHREMAMEPILQRAAERQGIDIFGHTWQLPTWSYIEPVADAEGDTAQLRNALTSPRRMHAARGKDWETIAEEIIDDNVYAIEKAQAKADEHNQKFPDAPPLGWRDLIPLPMPEGQTLALQDPAAVEAQQGKEQQPAVKPVAKAKRKPKAAGEWVTTEDGNRLYLEDGNLKTGPGKDIVPTRKLNQQETKQIATKDDAKQLLSQITQLRQSAKRQINREFEGEDPGIDLPQYREADKLEKQMNNAGFAVYKGSLFSRDEVQKLRETFNKNVTDYVKQNSGKKIPAEKVTQWESQIGMSVGDLKDLVSTLSLDDKKPQARSKKKLQPNSFDESKIKRDEDGRFGSGGGGAPKKTEDRRFPGRPEVGAVVEKKPTKIGVAKVVVTKSEDREVDFGDKAGTVIDDAVQMEVRIGSKVIKATKVGTTADVEREADKILKKAVENAEKTGQPALTKTVNHAGKDVEIEIVHDGYGAYHGQLKTAREDGTPIYTDDGSFKFHAPDRVGVPREGEFKSPERAAAVMEKRAEKFADKLSKAEQLQKEQDSRESDQQTNSTTESSEQTEQRHAAEQESLLTKHDEEFSDALESGAETDELDALTERHEAEMAELQRKHAKELDGDA